MRKTAYIRKHNNCSLAIVSFTLGIACSLPLSSPCSATSQDLPGLSIARLALPIILQDNHLLPSTGTAIGERAIDLKKAIHDLCLTSTANIEEVRSLYGEAITEIDGYHRLIGKIEAKLQLGTTPSNPNLIKLRDQAQSKLNEISMIVEGMESYADNCGMTLQKGDTLSLEIKETLLMPGALDEDHAHLLKMAEELDGFKASIVLSLNILTGNAERQKEWLMEEVSHFANLSKAIEKGRNPLPPQHSPDYPKFVELPNLASPLQSKSPVIISPKQKFHTTQSSSPLKGEPKKIQKELPIEYVPPNPVVHSISDENKTEEPLSKTEMLTTSQALKGRKPISIIESDQKLAQQKWYLFATVQRILKFPTDKIEVLSVMKNDHTNNRGDEIKSLLIDMGIPPNQIILKNVRTDEDQPECVLIVQSH